MNRIKQNVVCSKTSYTYCLADQNRPSDLWSIPHFGHLLYNSSTEFDYPSEEKNIQRSYSECFVFLSDLKTKMTTLISDWPIHFRLLLWNCRLWWILTERQYSMSIYYYCFCFRQIDIRAYTAWTDPSKRLHIVGRYAISGPMGA